MRDVQQIIALGLVLAGAISASPAPKDKQEDCYGDGHLPVIDLGYVKQQATSFNKTGDYFQFANIAFAQPPVGDLRFAAPQPPKRINGIQNGSKTRPICPQSTPDWLIQRLSGGFVPHVPQNASGEETEDCLYLDVLVPKPILEQKYHSRGAPVMVWIYGGGNVLGSKDDALNAPGLLKRSMDTTGTEGVVYVAMNYRVGNFGFLGGPLFKSQGGTPNAAFLDQRLALEWVKHNIAQFGGDPSRITVFGESGGAGAIAHQITAPGPKSYLKDVPFQQAIMQSPAETVIVYDDGADQTYQAWLKQLNVTTLAEARKLDTAVVQKANYDLIQAFPTGIFTYGFTRDNILGNESARKALLQGRTNGIKVFSSYNLNEGAIFDPGEGFTNDDFANYADGFVGPLTDAQLKYLTETLYPASAYPDARARAINFVAESLFTCNAVAVQQAYNSHGQHSWEYKFSVASALPNEAVGYHTEDIAFTYFNGLMANSEPANATIAEDLQTYLVNFAVHGTPNGFPSSVKLAKIPVYGNQHLMLNLTDTGYSVIHDTLATGAAKKRCDFFDQF